MAVKVPAARGCCEKAGGRQDHGGRCAEDRSGGGRQVARRKTHQKAEDASGAEVESKTEGIMGFPLQSPSEKVQTSRGPQDAF